MLISCILEYARTKTLTLTLSRFSIKSWLSDYGSLISHKKKNNHLIIIFRNLSILYLDIFEGSIG